MESTVEQKQKWEDLVLESFVNIVKSPDGDFTAIGQLAQLINDDNNFAVMVDFLSNQKQCKEAFVNRPRLGNVDLQKLSQLPQNTLGCNYAKHMIKNNLTPLQVTSVQNDSQFLNAHLGETHDIWHIVTGFDTSIIGEIELQSFCAEQLHCSRFFVSLLTKNLLKTIVYDIEKSHQYLEAIARGWLMAKQAQPLFGVQWNTLWDLPLEKIRRDFNIKIDER